MGTPTMADETALSLLTNPRSRNVFKEMVERQVELDASVDLFVEAMKRKLAQKTLEGYFGGLEDENYQEVLARLTDHWERFIKGDEFQIIDVANLLMMVWVIKKVGERTQEQF